MRKVWWFLLIISFCIALIVGADYMVRENAKEKLFSDITLIGHYKIGLLLGTGKYVGNGAPNLFYKYRIEAAVALYKARKIDYILVSGDNSRKEYSEPEMIRADLIAMGIPKEKIVLDFAGFRTLDSIIRCKEVFGEDNILVISQKFHNERAIFIAEKNDMKAVGFNAKDVEGRYGLKVILREKLARVKLLLDIAFNKRPKYLGNRIIIQ
jgi:SanA protein